MISAELEGISKAYHGKTILSDISFTGKSGDIIGLTGANGTGKTTLLKILSGVIRQDGGTFRLKGNVAYVPQDNTLFEDMTVMDNLHLAYSEGAAAYLKSDIQTGIIHEFGIDEYLKHRVGKLSGGTKKKLSIICALCRLGRDAEGKIKPGILLLDEPGASLDMTFKAEICDYFKSFAGGGGLVLIASHEGCEIDICTRIVKLD